MSNTLRFDRRTFGKSLAALPFLAYFAAQDVFGKAIAAPKENIYTLIGVRPFINARGTWTYISGSLELPEVRVAKQRASEHFVDMFELQRAVGKRLADLSGAESGLVTAGAAAAMATATAACIAGTDPARIWAVPDNPGGKREVIMFGGRSAFDSAIRAAGGKLLLAMNQHDLQAAINENTAMVYTTASGEELEKVLVITKRAGVPLFLDLASGIPPIENLSMPAKLGVDLYCFSGGKGLCGPQCSGLLLGRKDLIDAALANSPPWEGSVCRSMKVGKEEIMGVLAAVEAWKKRDLPALDQEWTRRLKRISRVVETIPGVTTEVVMPPAGALRCPNLAVKWDEAAFHLTIAECAKKLRDGDPRIEVNYPGNPSLVAAVREGDPNEKVKEPAPGQLRIVSLTLQPGEELIVARRLREVLSQARKAA